MIEYIIVSIFCWILILAGLIMIRDEFNNYSIGYDGIVVGGFFTLVGSIAFILTIKPFINF